MGFGQRRRLHHDIRQILTTTPEYVHHHLSHFELQAEHCAICECTAGQQGRTLAVSLALEGKADAYAIDRLIAGFEVTKLGTWSFSD